MDDGLQWIDASKPVESIMAEDLPEKGLNRYHALNPKGQDIDDIFSRHH